MVSTPPLFSFISYFGVPEPRIELGAALKQHDALPVCYVATLYATSPPYNMLRRHPQMLRRHPVGMPRRHPHIIPLYFFCIPLYEVRSLVAFCLLYQDWS